MLSAPSPSHRMLHTKTKLGVSDPEPPMEPSPEAAGRMIEITIPDGFDPSKVLELELEDGLVKFLNVPDGHKPGDILQVDPDRLSSHRTP